MDSEIIRAVQKDKLTSTSNNEQSVPTKISDDLYGEVISPLTAEFSDPIVAPHWWSKPADDLKSFICKTRINNTIWRQWYVHFVKGEETVIKFANPIPLADKYHSRHLAVVVEGHYWCRKHRTIRAQYKEWRKSKKPPTHPKIGKIEISNLLTTKNKDHLTSPGHDEMAFSGMINGHYDFDFGGLIDFDLPDFLTQTELILPEIQVPMQGPMQATNGYTDPSSLYLMSSVPDQPKNSPDTTSLNTLATAANMSQYYESDPRSQYLTNSTYARAGDMQPASYSTRGADLPYVRPSTMFEQQGRYGNGREMEQQQQQQQQQQQLQQQTNNAYIANNTYITPNIAVPKGPAYYPPTRLQYCYSADNGTVCPPAPAPYHMPLDQPYPAPQPTTFQKPKLTEQESDRKRRRAMKEKLQKLRQVLPASHCSAKQSHAALLNKAADYLRSEQAALRTLESELLQLASQIDQTREQIAGHQRQIPENGISSACFGSSIIELQYREFLEEQTAGNPLMKLYALLLEPLFRSFNSMVDNTSLDSFCKTAHRWFAQNCSLSKIRELATNLVTSPHLEFESENS